MDKVDAHIDAHIGWLKDQHEKGHFIASGRKVPRTGGVILADMPTREDLDAVLAHDPSFANAPYLRTSGTSHLLTGSARE